MCVMSTLYNYMRSHAVPPTNNVHSRVVHPVSITRFPSFRTQTLENLSDLNEKMGSWATQTLAKIL